ncbi:Hsp90 cochaperone STI1 NDAI_0F00910 [Naumovozyma dairenensis CBS 421]|uniref:STI1 domain-containing protein n=1 Tax=Naumovozyma dairenensis (strain ATCC 10597 / BCRC 20456 / CBS 421 / NBRC 0211 / NRRL Y-12639) TaxID=1071378 RepID=G0WC99_NAUDC|nr:hypothetical protein NDAI_0F00910 [Naumovozyma dairenensis CBS 421]CCD25410.1 hypothetical protein NDAI_0F00910 [Naumovozyma dairenensis CBS 421]
MSLTADEYKQQGNAAFTSKDFNKAIELFTKAIEVSPTPNHVLYSNRSAAYTSAKQFQEALNDATECVKINPTWSKGYNRLGAAEFGLGNLEEAEKNYKEALKLDNNNNKAAQDGLDQIERAKNAPPPNDFGLTSMFTDPNLIDKLKANPKTKDFMNDPVFVGKILGYQKNPASMTQDMMTDPRLMTVLAALMGIDLNMGQDSTPPSAAAAAAPAPADEASAESAQTNQQEETTAPEPMEVDEKEEDKESNSKLEADEAKVEGNKLYKAHKFDEAIEQYNKAWALNKDITYLNNRSAAEFEKGDFETAIATLNEAVDQGRELRADYKIIAKSFARIGNAYHKKGDLKKSIDYYQKSLTEHRTADILTKLRNCEKELKKQEAEQYIDPEKAEEARLEGKEYFTKGDWPNAVKAYSEMIKRAPEDARGYSNRAAALSKLMSFPEAIKDCDNAIKKDPNFVRAYIRKATAQIAIKEYANALDTLEEAKSKDSSVNNGANSNEIMRLQMKATQERFQAPTGNETPEETYKRAMQDPEVAAIMQDPVMQSILQQAQTNPAALQEHMKNPEISKKIQILIAAGIIRTGYN